MVSVKLYKSGIMAIKLSATDRVRLVLREHFGSWNRYIADVKRKPHSYPKRFELGKIKKLQGVEKRYKIKLNYNK